MQDKASNNETSINSQAAIAELKTTFHSPSTTSNPINKALPISNHRANVNSNNIFQTLLFDPQMTAAEKHNAMVQALLFNDKDSENDGSESLKQFIQFNQLLQQEHKQLAQKITAVSDTEVFSELNSVHDETFNALISFETKVTELTDMVDAIYTLRMQGITYDVLREIAKVKEAEFKLASQRAELEQERESLTNAVKDKTRQIAVLEQDLTLFGFGVISRASREKIALLKIEILDHNEAIVTLAQQIANLPNEVTIETNWAEYTEQKTKLRELLALSPLQHKERHKALINAAQDFIRKSEERLNRITKHIETMGSQINSLSEANVNMSEFYAIVNAATKEANIQNETLRLSLQSVEPLEAEHERDARERRKENLTLHIKSLAESAQHSQAVVAELAELGDKIKSMQQANIEQIANTRQLYNSSKLGIAGLASQLSTAVQAVSSAALGEASKMAGLSLAQMQKLSDSIWQKEGVCLAQLSQQSEAEFNPLSPENVMDSKVELKKLDAALLGSTKGLLSRSDLLTQEY
ncbi:hypothetical protein [Motilimonas sp. E26]|uniref:hypothetical protein n=1 Tax=Motilimonas sp. E26 TaxID=2865674 RepID=UPI001E3C979D|nr:hypothetical protein [Motilimonas sp. E26]MCE0556866.1 hypothetical protein [Motilimonas sp. E26]